jgi:tRNA pseudouridine synthase 10
MVNSLKDKKNIQIAEKTLKKYKLCDHCLGRVFAQIEKGKTNKKRGETVRILTKKNKETEICDCWLCEGLLEDITHFVELISKSLKGYEFDTFLVGTKIDEDIVGREQELYDYTGSEFSESIKTELNREIGKILEKELRREVNFEKPDIMAVVDTCFDVVDLQISSLFIYGRYKKFSREIPQTRWFCKICRGKGCKKCDYTGKIYDKSVEELVAEKFLKETHGDEESFHGAGREDIDVRMLGNGRPFILEIKNPKIRNIDLNKMKSDINKKNKYMIEVNDLRFSNREEIAEIKSAKMKKVYRVTFKCEKPVKYEKLIKAAQSLQGKKISQSTPSRVAHRRADLIRPKYVYNCDVEKVDGNISTLTLETESGTYIKELVSGDNGKTKPSISELIGAPCNVTQLDVIEIKGE